MPETSFDDDPGKQKTVAFKVEVFDDPLEAGSVNNNIDPTSKVINRFSILRKQGKTKSTALPVVHKEEGWHEASHIWNWQRQAKIIITCQKAHWIVLPPSIFIHFFLKRDWGMAVGPFFAFAIYGDVRSLDLFLAASLGGVICGVFKHLIRSPRPFWIVPEVFLKEGVEEMSWGTPSAHSAIQGAITAVLIYYDYENPVSWVVNILLLLFTMFSRLFLAVHWPQDVVLGAVIGIVAGCVICFSTIHRCLLEFAEDYYPYGGILYLSIGFAYNVFIYIIVKLLDRISDNNPVPEAAIQRYKIGVARALRILQGTQAEDIVEESPPDIADKPLPTFDNNRSTALSSQRPSMRLKNTGISMRTWVGASPKRNLPISVQVKSQRGWMNANKILEDAGIMDEDTEDSDEGHDPDHDELKALNIVSKAIETANSAHYFKSAKDLNILQDNMEKEKKEQGVFLRTDVVFHPDGKDRFWYNSINVMGTYAGLALYSCVISRVDEVEFVPTLKWCAALYATGITFSLIVYTRTVLRSMLTRVHFKRTREFVYFFIGFFTYGLFPLSYYALENAVKSNTKTSM